MGIFSSLFQTRSHPSRPSDRLLAIFDQGNETASGVSVAPENSLQVTAVYACVRALAESEAMLPLIMYRRLARGKERANNHPLYPILHDAPNPEMTAYEFRETLTGHMALRGNAYAEIEWTIGGQVRYLWPMRADRVTPERANGTLSYVVTMPNGSAVKLPGWRVLHLRGFGNDGVRGYSPVYLARQAVGLAMATEEFGARLFGNGAKPGGILEHPGQLSGEAQKRLRDSIEDRHQGLSNAHRMMILEEGMTWKQVGIAPDEAQFLETRQYQTTEIARLFRMPPHMIGDLTRSTNNNIEHQGIEFVTHTLNPWLVRWEQRIAAALLSTSEKREFYAEHLVDALLRGDTASRYTAYNTGIMAGILTRNEVRERENLNPIDGLDVPLVPLNMVEVGQTPTETQPGTPNNRSVDEMERRARDVGGSRQAIASAQVGLLEDATQRVVRREVADVRWAVDKYLVKRQDTTGFLLWLDEFYKEHQAFTVRTMKPSYTAIANLTLGSVARELGKPDLSGRTGDLLDFVQSYLDALGIRWASSSANQLRAIIREAAADGNRDAAEELNGRLNNWNDEEASREARRESVRSVNAFAYAAYGWASVAALRWVTFGENCPYCDAMNGRIVAYDREFVGSGNFAPDGAASMLIRRAIKHAPLHDGCDCQVIAA